jgi:guanylate kinase
LDGRVLLFVGPDGSGRNTLAQAMGITFHIPRVVSYTTRPRRKNETDGKEYFFVSESLFTRKQQNGDFIEVVESDSYFYGIQKEDCEQCLSEYGSFYAVLSPQGCEIFKQEFANVLTILVYASKETVVTRQKLRGDDLATIERHVKHYQHIMEYQSQCDIVIANNDLASTAQELSSRIETHLQIVHHPDSKY